MPRKFYLCSPLLSGGITNEPAEHERIAPSYMTRVMRLTLLAPEIVEAIVNGREAVGVPLVSVMQPFPAGWQKQRGVVF